jgi:hypothetical protein
VPTAGLAVDPRPLVAATDMRGRGPLTLRVSGARAAKHSAGPGPKGRVQRGAAPLDNRTQRGNLPLLRQPSERLRLDLPDAFAGDAEDPPDLLE